MWHRGADWLLFVTLVRKVKARYTDLSLRFLMLVSQSMNQKRSV
jgi:hypothetical protein